MSEITRCIIYTDIASILDLRQGYLASVTDDYEKLREYLLSPEYHERSVDEFPFGEEGGYLKAYRSGDMSILNGASLNFNLTTITNRISDSDIRNKFNDELTVPEIWFNTHPFKLTKEQKELFREALFIKVGKNTKIEMVEIPPESLSPEMMKESGFITALIYDFGEWLDLHANNLMTNPNHDCPIHFAPIMRKCLSTIDVETIEKSGFGDLFNFVEFSLSLYCKLIFPPMAFYSSFPTAQCLLEEYNEATKKMVDKKASEIEIPEEMLNEYFSATSQVPGS